MESIEFIDQEDIAVGCVIDIVGVYEGARLKGLVRCPHGHLVAVIETDECEAVRLVCNKDGTTAPEAE